MKKSHRKSGRILCLVEKLGKAGCVSAGLLVVFAGVALASVPVGSALCKGNYPSTEEAEMISYTEFMGNVDKGEADTVYYSEGLAEMYEDCGGVLYKTRAPEDEGFADTLLEKDVVVDFVSSIDSYESHMDKFKTARVCGIVFGIVDALFLLYCARNGEELGIGKTKAVAYGGTDGDERREDPSAKKFSDVAGLCEVKKDMASLVDFLKNREKYEQMGAKLPKGVILYGPPGTGKTLLAKAVAGEAGVPFFYMSGSEFIEMYVGVGAKRVRELFAKARKSAPCIVFIDEIDTIGQARGRESNSEDRKTINALLTEMDGFKESENVIVIGATNRLEDLDPALTRPGRFTDKFCVPVPETVDERLEIVDIYTKNKKLGDDVDTRALAKECVGFSPAQIEALVNESAIIAVQEGCEYISKFHIDRAMFKILLQGHAKEGLDGRDEEEVKVVAWHEAGHAIVGRLMGKEITKVTVVPSTSGAGGVTFSTPTKTHLLNLEDTKHEVMELYGGRVGEYYLYGGDESKLTTGASNDIERASSIIRNAIVKCGFDPKVGYLNLEVLSQDRRLDIKEQASEFAHEAEAETKELLGRYSESLRALAEKLIEEQTVYLEDVDEAIRVTDAEFGEERAAV